MMKPKIVCLCGSTKFKKKFVEINYNETLKGNIVLSIGCDTKNDDELKITPEQKAKLDILHLQKIDLSDEVIILNVNNYIDESTMRELLYAEECNKTIIFLEPRKQTDKKLSMKY